MFKNARGFAIHRGLCAEANGEDADMLLACSKKKRRTEPEEEEEPLEGDCADGLMMDIDTGDASAPDEPVDEMNYFGSTTDASIAELYFKFPTLSKGMLDDILRITRQGPAVNATADHLLERVDKLPGVYVDVQLPCIVACRVTHSQGLSLSRPLP